MYRIKQFAQQRVTSHTQLSLSTVK